LNWLRKYRLSLKGEAIVLDGRVFAVIDAFDAVASDRPYSAARTYDEAVRILREESGTHLDPVVVEAFLSLPPQHLDVIPERVVEF
jgi:energy-coupling factor transport system substrate-specific component